MAKFKVGDRVTPLTVRDSRTGTIVEIEGVQFFRYRVLWDTDCGNKRTWMAEKGLVVI